MFSSLLTALDFSVYYHKRGGAELRALVSRIEAEGGKIEKISRVGFFIHSPFSGIRMCPLYHQFRTRYGNRSGTWFVATSADNSAGVWAWADANSHDTLPVARDDGAFVDNKAMAMGFITSLTILYTGLGLFIWMLFQHFSQ